MIGAVGQGVIHVADTASGAAETKTATTSFTNDVEPTTSKYFVQDSVEISNRARELYHGYDVKQTTCPGADHRFDTRESRDNQAERLDNILQDLRGKYDEEEAMRQFTEVMRQEGFEVKDSKYHATEQNYAVARSGNLRLVLRTNWGFFNPQVASLKAQPEVPTFDFSSNLYTYSSTVVHKKTNNEIESQTNTWAVYDAFSMQSLPKTIEFWENRNMDDLNSQTDFDMRGYVDNLVTPGYDIFSAESVSTTLASSVSAILQQAGVTLEAGQEISMYTRVNNNGGVNGINIKTTFGDEQLNAKIQAVFDRVATPNSSILNQFIEEEGKVENYNLDLLPDACKNGTQSVTFYQHRGFILSGSEPSMVVMGSFLHGQGEGYTFQKIVSDKFSFESDLFSVTGRSYDYTELANSQFNRDVAEMGVSLYNEYVGYKSGVTA